MNPLDSEWFYRDFDKSLREVFPKYQADELWEDAGREYKRILSQDTKIKQRKGAMVLPAAAFYRTLRKHGKDASGLLNQYGKLMGRRFAGIIHVFTSLPGVDRFVWRHVEFDLEKV